MKLWDRIETVRDEIDVLRHPFYVRWSAGELTRAELARYAGEYRHAVVALASAARSAGAQAAAEAPAHAAALRAHAAEEAEHVAVWDRFAAAVGADTTRRPLAETAACAAAWTGRADQSLVHRLVGIYAIEAAQPAISTAKLAGLREHYDLDTPDATAYFELHIERDVEHAAAGRALIDELLPAAAVPEDALVARAESVLRANWGLLSGLSPAHAADSPGGELPGS
jgi:pyrroloquinoline-quinone synthase